MKKNYNLLSDGGTYHFGVSFKSPLERRKKGALHLTFGRYGDERTACLDKVTSFLLFTNLFLLQYGNLCTFITTSIGGVLKGQPAPF